MALKMRTFIHIGQHKTATKSIQHYLKRNREYYIEKGLYFPNSLMGYEQPNHFLLNVASLNEDRFSTKKKKLFESKAPIFFKSLPQNLDNSIKQIYLDAKKNNCNDVIWSSEGLYLLNSKEEYQRLKGLIFKYSKNITIICTFREKKSFQISYLNQLQKKGLKPSDNKDSYRYLKDDSWLLDYERKKHLLNEVFNANTIYINYCPIDMIKKFFSAIGYETVGETSLRLNVSDI
jgi:hypothetical protein